MAKQRRLSDKQVREIRKKYNTPCPCCGKRPSLEDLSRVFEVSTVTVFRAANGLYRFSSID
jgi:hypothetical protein